MIRHRQSRRSPLAVAALAALAAAWAPAGAAGEPADAAAVSATQVRERPAEVRKYWTPKRMASARPASELLAGLPLVNDLLDGLLGGGQPAARSTAQPVPAPQRPKLRTHGKVYFRLAGEDYVCSATVVRSKIKRLVMTAGHCVHGFGRFASRWLFVPAKNGESEPYGRWTARRLATTRQWAIAEDLRYDVATATLAKRKGRRIQKVLGARPVAFNQGRKVRFNIMGYPDAAPFNGNYPYRCTSPAQGTDTGPPPAPTRIDCDMTAGASGGGWIKGGGKLNGVTSYGYETPVCLPLLCPRNPEEGKLFGPYFGNVVRDLYRSERR